MSSKIKRFLYLLERPNLISINYSSIKAEKQVIALNEQESRVMQHEIDHFEGNWPKEKAVKLQSLKELEDEEVMTKFQEEQTELGRMIFFS